MILSYTHVHWLIFTCLPIHALIHVWSIDFCVFSLFVHSNWGDAPPSSSSRMAQNLTVSSFGARSTRIHWSGRVSQPETHSQHLWKSPRSLHPWGVFKNVNRFDSKLPPKRIGQATICGTKSGQKCPDVSGFWLDTPIGNNCSRSITDHRPSRAQFSRTRSVGRSLT